MRQSHVLRKTLLRRSNIAHDLRIGKVHTVYVHVSLNLICVHARPGEETVLSRTNSTENKHAHVWQWHDEPYVVNTMMHGITSHLEMKPQLVLQTFAKCFSRYIRQLKWAENFCETIFFIPHRLLPQPRCHHVIVSFCTAVPRTHLQEQKCNKYLQGNR